MIFMSLYMIIHGGRELKRSIDEERTE